MIRIRWRSCRATGNHSPTRPRSSRSPTTKPPIWFATGRTGFALPLNPGVVDVFLRAFDQVPGDRSGPTGRLTSLRQGIAEHYSPGRGQPQRIVVKQRSGFASLTTTAHNSTTGVTESVSWSNPE